MGLKVSALPSKHIIPSPLSADVLVSGGNGDAAGNSNGNHAEEQVPEVPTRGPAVYLAANHEQVKLQAKNVKTAMDSTQGVKTYRSTWRMYDKWHVQRFGVPAPRCLPWLDIIWVDRGYATDFLAASAGSNGMTSSMVSSSSCPSLMQSEVLLPHE